MTEREQFETFEAWFRAVYMKRGYVSSKEELREVWIAARATPALPQLPECMAIVPVEPTDEMVDYAERMDWSIPDSRAVVINIWQAMLAAAKEKGE